MAGQDSLHTQFRADVERIRFEYLRAAAQGNPRAYRRRLRFRAILCAMSACIAGVLFAFDAYLLVTHRIAGSKKLWAIGWLVIYALATNISFFWYRWYRTCMARAATVGEPMNGK